MGDPVRKMEQDAADLAAVIMWQEQEIEALTERVHHNQRLLGRLNDAIEDRGGTPTHTANRDNFRNHAERVMRRRKWRIDVWR